MSRRLRRRTQTCHREGRLWCFASDQCTFVSETGERCPARGFLELDHIVPRAGGGPDTLENLRVRCRHHNQHAAERAFGRARVEKKIAERRAGLSESYEKARDALVRMGYTRGVVRRVMETMQNDHRERTLEQILREGLQILSP